MKTRIKRLEGAQQRWIVAFMINEAILTHAVGDDKERGLYNKLCDGESNKEKERV